MLNPPKQIPVLRDLTQGTHHHHRLLPWLRSETDYDLDYDLRRLWREAKQTLERMPEEQEGSISASGVSSVAHQALARARQKCKSPPTRTAGLPFIQQEWSRPLPSLATYGSTPSASSSRRIHGLGDDTEENEAMDESTEGVLLKTSLNTAGGISRLNEMLTSPDQGVADRTRYIL